MDQPEFRSSSSRRQAADPVIRKSEGWTRNESWTFRPHRDGETPHAQLFDERLAFIQAADAAGFYCLHLAEHHQTPLNMVPVPGVFMGAVARLTKTIKIGPLVYLLPLYSPLRMIDEICMLDHLSHGRAEIGVGRGVSPFELRYNKVDPEKSREIFIEAYRCIAKGLTTDSSPTRGRTTNTRTCRLRSARCSSRIRRSGTAPSGAEGSTWAGEEGLHFVTLGGQPVRQDQPRHLQGGVRQARRQGGAAEARVFRWHRARGPAPHLRRRDRREGQGLGQARHGEPPRQHQLDQEQARRDDDGRAHEKRARPELRGVRSGGHGDRRLAEDRAGRDREAA
jgi:alkanesulfonate monooxygenase SsuD/methylene tetrahydromethanopterin reductase-like flavin-dependent oxidoreductase (luciferase family)